MRRAGLILILAAAAAARMWFLTAGVPHAVGIDEPQIVDRAIRILRTGDWNTHIFDYPTLVIYFHSAVAIVRFLFGALEGEWRSLDGFTVQAIYTAGRFAAACLGVATVWLTYKLGSGLASRNIGLLAAAQVAVRPMHVRESHFILTDVPMTMLTTFALWLSVRAMRLGTVSAYAWAGALCGFAAAAKYTGGVAIVAVLAAWAVRERAAPGRLLKLAAILGAAALAFLVAAPYTILDMPAFLDGFAAQFARFATPAPAGDPPWLLYLKHLSPVGARVSVPLAIAGMILILARGRTRAAAIPVVTFTLAYFYVIASHSHVFGRYALPLVPVLAIYIAVVLAEVVSALARVPALKRPGLQPMLAAALVGVILIPMAGETVRWLDQLKRADTRTLATDWLKANAPKGARVAVENSGPTYLDAAGFRVLGNELIIEHPPEWYRSRADFLVISGADEARYSDYIGMGPTVFQVTPAQRWGPPIRIVKLGNGEISTFPDFQIR